MNPLSKIFFVLVLALLGACGGGGGGDSSSAGGGTSSGTVAGGTGTGTSTPVVSTPLSTAKALTAFSVASVPATIDESRKTIAVTLPYDTDIRALVATFTTTGSQVAVGAAVQASNDTPNDFSATTTYTVTAADGSTVSYRATVTLAPSSAKAITSFSVAGAQASIDETARKIAITVPFDTNLNALIATYSTTGAVVRVGPNPQTSRFSINNFSNAVVYTVTAVDGSSASYAVSVTVARSSAKSFSSFELVTPGGRTAFGTIDQTARTIKASVPYGTSLASLVARYTLSGTASIGSVAQVSGSTANSFAAPVVYTVAAQDGSAVSYTVSVSVAPPTPLAVNSTTPTSGSNTGAPTAAIVVMLNKALSADTCTTANFKLSGGVTGTVRCSGTSISFTPSSALALASNYTATLGKGLKDTDGLSLASDHVWGFKTRSEYVAPSVVGSSFSGSVVKFEFSEAMNIGTVTPVTVTLDPAVAGTVSTDGVTAAFTPASPLAKGQVYTVNVTGAQDTAGNPLSPSYSKAFQTDPGSVTPVEYYGGGRFCGSSKYFSVQLVNETALNQDVQLRIHNAGSINPNIYTYRNLAPGAKTGLSVNPNTSEIYADAGVCFSNGQYTVTWTPTGAAASSAKTRTYTSTTWVPNAPLLDSCFLGGSISAPNCVNPLTVPPVVITPTSPVSTTAPSGTLGAETSPDADGCYVPQHQPECLVVEKLAYSAYSSGQVNLRLRNHCTRRVYADFCLQLNSGKWDCGADGAAPGGAITWWSFDAKPLAIYQYTGSTKASSDWVCHGLDPNLRKKFP